MKCPECGAAELVHDVCDIPYTYKGKTTVIPQVDADFCTVCGEIVADMDESERVMDAMREFRKLVRL